MAIQVGEKVPAIKLKVIGPDGPEDVSAEELFAGKKSMLFAVPGAFTPLCSDQHLPGFIQKAKDIKAKGVDAIYCLAVNDAFVMSAWAEERGAGDAVTLLADGSADFTKAVGLEMDGSDFGMGIRSQRYAAVIEDSVITHLAVEAPMKVEASGADAILEVL